MRLQILGTSAAWYNNQDPSSCYLVQTDKTALLLDIGHGAMGSVNKYASGVEITDVFISHAHMDHIADLTALKYDLEFGHRQRQKPHLHLSPETLARLDLIRQAIGAKDSWLADSFRVSVFEPGDILHLSDMSLKTQPMAHFIQSTALRIEAATGTITYSADLGSGSIDDMTKLAIGSDIFICEAAIPAALNVFHQARMGHIDPKQAATIAYDAGVKKLLLTHLPNTYFPDLALAQAQEIFKSSALAQVGKVYTSF